MDTIYSILGTILPLEAYQYTFMKNAFLAILLLTPLLGLLGTMAVNHQMAFFSDALGHSALTGIGLGIILGLRNDLVAMLVFGIIWAILICVIKQSGSASADTVISVFSSTSVAAGLLILARGGNLIGTLVFWALLYNSLLLTSVDSFLARSRGIKTRLVECAFVVIVAVAVMLSIRWVGLMLINVLLILPAAAGRNIARSSRQHAVWSVVLALFSGLLGLTLSYYLDTSAGASIVLVSALCYAVSLAVRSARK